MKSKGGQRSFSVQKKLPVPIRAGMKITQRSNLSRIRLCLDTAPEFGLSEDEARSIVEAQVRGIAENFDGLCEEIGMSPTTRSQLRRRAVLNPDVFAGCEELNPKGW